MKRFSLACIAATATCVLTSCDPQAFSMNIEMRYPSKSGINLTGKSVAVVYLEDGAGKDSVFSRNMADSFAASLERSISEAKHPYRYIVLKRRETAITLL